MQNYKIKKMTMTALMAAVMCVLGPLSIQIGPIPISLTNLAIYLAVYIVGGKMATLSYLVYFLIGLFGMPVFSGGGAGPAKAVGPTGGYLIGFFLLALICGLFIDRKWNLPKPVKYMLHFIGMCLGTAVAYIFGTIWFVVSTQTEIVKAIMTCVVPFIGVDILKMIIALVIGGTIKEVLEKSGVLSR